MKRLNPTYFILILSSIFLSQCAASKKIISAEKNAETIKLWFEEGWNNKKYDELIPVCFAEDWSDENPIRPEQIDGHEGMKQLVQSYLTAFPDINFAITNIVADENQVAVRFEVTATHKGEIFGFKPTNQEIFSSGINIFQMERGKIKKTWSELDLAGVLNQLDP